jgi:hypothetical protein
VTSHLGGPSFAARRGEDTCCRSVQPSCAGGPGYLVEVTTNDIMRLCLPQPFWAILDSKAAISASRPRVACWYLIAAAGELCPRRAINSAVVAPVLAAIVPDVCLRSCQRKSSRPAALRALPHCLARMWGGRCSAGVSRWAGKSNESESGAT